VSRPAIAILLLLLAAPVLAGTDLSKLYPATIDRAEAKYCRSWTVGPDDVFKIDSFHYAVGKDFEVSVKKAVAVFGHWDRNVVWAVVLPEKPGKVRWKETGEEEVVNLYLRFAPSRLAELFPRKKVRKNGPAEALIPAKRIHAAKINAWCQIDNMPVIPEEPWIMLDVETPEKKRRMFMTDTGKLSVKYEPFFADKAVMPPPAEKIEKGDALAAYDKVWETFDRQYAMFVIRPEVDWKKLGSIYRKVAAKAETRYEAAGAIALLLSHLRDLHVWVRAGDEWLPGYRRLRIGNGNPRALREFLIGISGPEEDVSWGRTADGIGYISVWGLSKPGAVETFHRALDELMDTKALVVDLRFNGGGDETMARKMAGRFVDRARVYSYSQYRAGKRHDQLTEKIPRKFGPNGKRYEKPVICLFGRKTMSSAESMALMFGECPQVTTMGDHTAGSSANPMQLHLPGRITVNMPRWLDMDPSGQPIDEVGVKPDVLVRPALDEFRNDDPVMRAALERLRKKE
jgi:hypothetical protein